MTRHPLFFALFLLAASALQAQTLPDGQHPGSASIAALHAGFANPPATAKLRCYWWWLNGNTNEETITHDLIEMRKKGFGGVLLVDANGSNQNGHQNIPAGPTFASPAWTKLYLHALKIASEQHLEVTLNITSGWNLGGPDVKPEEASKLLTWSRTQITSGKYQGTLPIPRIRNGFYREIAVLAYPLHHGAALAGRGADRRAPISALIFKSAAMETGFSMPPSEPLLNDAPAVNGEEDTRLNEVVNLSDKVDSAGHLDWQPPTAGAWEILRIGYTDSDKRVSTASGAWQGLAIDYLDRNAFDSYWDHTVAPLLEASRPYLKTTLIALATDSWEVGGTNWTGRFAEEFRRRRGYDPLPYLPVLSGRLVQDRAISNRFLNDLRRTVGDLITDHFDHYADRASEYGLGVQSESGGPHGAPIDALETYRRSTIPQSEYWAPSKEHRSRDEERFFTKEVASAANIYGKHFAAQEGMTSIGPQWSESLARDLKPAMDRAFTEGMNRLVWHEFTSSPESFGLPGYEYFAGTHINPKITWWNQSAEFFLYANRLQFLLQQGYAVNDVLYYYGDHVPNFIRLKQEDPAHVLPGYDYDGVNQDALLHSLSMQDGVIATPAGNHYRLLAMPLSRRISLPVLQWIAAYVQQGGSIAGPMPQSATGIVPEADAQQATQLIHDLWADCAQPEHSYGRGHVFCTANAHEALSQLQIAPDFDSASPHLDYVHRCSGITEIYFVRNGSAHAVDTMASFRVSGRTPELWNAVDGTIASPTHFQDSGRTTQLPLHLAPYGSLVVIFPEASSTPASPQQAESQQTTIDLPASQWTLSFQPNRGAPNAPIRLQKFSSWTESPDPGVRYFSGTATYRTTAKVHVVPGQRTVLKLTDLHEICTVRVNGQEAGTIWALPYELNLSGKLVDGTNTIELDVTNLWPNRIIGDAQPGVTHPFTKTNIRKYTSSSPLLPSGLLGPVVLETSLDLP